jgi:hypothetical protein
MCIAKKMKKYAFGKAVNPKPEHTQLSSSEEESHGT